jgi:hypothetical protein
LGALGDLHIHQNFNPRIGHKKHVHKNTFSFYPILCFFITFFFPPTLASDYGWGQPHLKTNDNEQLVALFISPFCHLGLIKANFCLLYHCFFFLR